MLPQSHEPFTDKYFLRTRDILEAEGVNPYVRAQVFIRKGPGTVHGMDEALEILNTYSDIEHTGSVFALQEGADYGAAETLMVIEGPIQSIVALETMYLGVLSAETSKANDGSSIDLSSVRDNMAAVVDAARGKPVSYFGARHWRFDEDAAIAHAAYEGGALSCSTDAGAGTYGAKGLGTIPHVLENICAWKSGVGNAVVEATLAFDRNIDSAVPRIALIDYANREVDDAVATARALDGRLYGVRIDTCGENVAQGAAASHARKYWGGTGVTVTGVKAIRDGLNAAGFEDVKIMLSSGFGKVEKVRAFVEAEEEFGMKLFDGLGVGGVYPARMATMDVVAVGATRETMVPMSKVGRLYKPNSRLELVLGGRR